MDTHTITHLPNRVSDLVNLKKLGGDLTIDPTFEIVPVNFAQGDCSYQAYIFLCRFEGLADQKPFSFRKCYAKGCPHNLCPHVAQAVMIANRYLKRDYKKLEAVGVPLQEKFFSLEEMVAGYDTAFEQASDEVTGGILTIHDYINMAKEGTAIRVETRVEIIPGVEHFAGRKNEQSFLMVDFDITAFGNKFRFQRCVACYGSRKEDEEKPFAVATGNERLKLLYAEFDAAGIDYNLCFFT
ncbi:MAG: hypothetical protein HUN04_23630 [Desulfobacter sp.]|nr:MAG: hypothetical protein HUN04_23630 [Desulfobacter sp.]